MLKSKQRIVFMGTPEFAVPSLQALYEEGHEIAAVITQPDKPKGRGQKLSYSPVKEKALGLGLQVLQPPKVRAAEEISQIRELRPDIIVVVAYGQILPQELLDIPPLGCINVHGSLLPAYRGAAPLQRAILNGEKKTGITTMLMNAGLDTGDILLQKEIEITPDMTFGELHDKMAALGAQLLCETIELLAAGQITPRPQEDSAATYAAMIKREDELIRWEETAEHIHNQIRGLAPWPGAYTFFQGQTLKIRGSKLFDTDAQEAAPGTVVQKIKGQGFVVQCGLGRLLVTAVQPNGKKIMPAESFANGYRLETGYVFSAGKN